MLLKYPSAVSRLLQNEIHSSPPPTERKPENCLENSFLLENYLVKTCSWRLE